MSRTHLAACDAAIPRIEYHGASPENTAGGALVLFDSQHQRLEHLIGLGVAGGLLISHQSVPRVDGAGRHEGEGEAHNLRSNTAGGGASCYGGFTPQEIAAPRWWGTNTVWMAVFTAAGIRALQLHSLARGSTACMYCNVPTAVTGTVRAGATAAHFSTLCTHQEEVLSERHLVR